MKKLVFLILLLTTLSGCTARDSYAARYFGGGLAIGGTSMAVVGANRGQYTTRNSGIGLASVGALMFALSFWEISDTID